MRGGLARRFDSAAAREGAPRWTSALENAADSSAGVRVPPGVILGGRVGIEYAVDDTLAVPAYKLEPRLAELAVDDAGASHLLFVFLAASA